jgi:hypothetical protein
MDASMWLLQCVMELYNKPQIHMAQLSKPKYRIKHIADYKGNNGYAWDNGIIAFGAREEERGHEGSPTPKSKRVVNNL